MSGAIGAVAFGGMASALPTNPDVVIVGAGSAGIGAARKLMAEGRSVLVVEASNRIGGRAYTESDTFGVPYDQGCAWLQGPRNLPHVSLAQDLGFKLVDHNSASDSFRIDGAPAPRKEKAKYDRAFETLYEEVWQADDVSIASMLPEGMPYSAEAQTWTTMGYGMDMANVSTADMNAYAEYQVNYLVREGLGTLVATLGRDVPVKLNTAVEAIDWSGDGVKIITSDGTISAQTCIVTVSPGVLAAGGIRFTPELPVAKQQAVQDLPMGLLTKVALQFDGERFGLTPNNWLSYALPSQQVPAEACYFVTFPTGLDLAVGFLGGDFAWDMSAKGADVAIDFAVEEFAKAVGSDARKHFIKGHMSDWHANPFTRGAYAAAKPGRFGARQDLKDPLGDRVFFAGEAVGVPLAALCSGAHLSGENAAQMALASMDSGACSSCDARGAAKQKLQKAISE